LISALRALRAVLGAAEAVPEALQAVLRVLRASPEAVQAVLRAKRPESQECQRNHRWVILDDLVYSEPSGWYLTL
jgi:hypothetical protein